ncbi:MAG: NAD(P)-binding protein [Deltaproteobacteria bacterium]|nr:NAD(P)-binding protein [Deltaproteobacteria bacterium]
MSDFDYDQVVIGSGFGGSVAALRLAQKGYDVLVLVAPNELGDASLFLGARPRVHRSPARRLPAPRGGAQRRGRGRRKRRVRQHPLLPARLVLRYTGGPGDGWTGGSRPLLRPGRAHDGRRAQRDHHGYRSRGRRDRQGPGTR